jgi:hypothetical protein
MILTKIESQESENNAKGEREEGKLKNRGRIEDETAAKDSKACGRSKREFYS